MRARTIAALTLLSTTVAQGTGDASRQLGEPEPMLYTHDPCVLTRTPENECRRFRLVNYGNGRTETIRIVLTSQQRAAAEVWWNRPENRWRRP